MQDEHRLAADGLKAASLAYQRTLGDCRRRLANAREWLEESRRRLRQAERAAQAAGIEVERGNRPVIGSSHTGRE